MSTFFVPKTISLDFLGEGWADCYIRLNAFTINDIKTMMTHATLTDASDPKDLIKASEDIIGIMQERFIDGLGFDGTKTFAITKDILGELPQQVITRVSQVMGGMISPKD